MAWLWKSWDEYVSYVGPTSISNPRVVRIARNESSFERHERLINAAAEFERALNGLYGAGFHGSQDGHDIEVNDETRSLVEDLLHTGEEFLLYHRRLGVLPETYDFAHCHDVEVHWDRNLGSPRACEEINELVGAARALLVKYHAIKSDDAKFLVDGLDLPEALIGDFTLARDLFSVGFDAVGVLIAGRGLEGVLRAIAARRKIAIVSKGHTQPAAEADLHDLIEAMYRVRWKVRNARLISAQARGLLQYLRTVRNSHAHPGGADTLLESESREFAVVLASSAKRLWSQAASRARLDPLAVVKNW